MRACYHCLSTGIEPTETTGDGEELCPECGIDSVTDYTTEEELYEKHCSGFHWGYILSELETEKELVPIVCGLKMCKDWDEQVRREKQ